MASQTRARARGWQQTGVITFIGSAVTLQARGKPRAGPDVPVGWPNRFLVVTYVTWLAVAAWTVLQR